MAEWYIETEKDQLQKGFLIHEHLFVGESPFQKVEVFRTETYGNMLTLDGCVMLTDKDEFVYHEMIAHVPVCFHKNPETVVVIGGGDGGTVRELLKHDCVKKIILCEIDQMVIDVSEKYFPKVAGCLRDPRVEVLVDDGIAYIKNLTDFADVIIVDSTDPVGPGEGLFTGEFYRGVAKALKKGGLVVAQSESPWDESGIPKRIYENMKGGFAHVKPYAAPIPTYPRGYWSWSVGSQTDLQEADFIASRFEHVAPGLSYLTKGKMVSLFEISGFHKRNLGMV
jgi:spermidine synthase